MRLGARAWQLLGLGVVTAALVAGIVALAVRAEPDLGPVVISEFMASNGATIADEDGDYRDWIELHNLGPEPVDLGGYYLSDDDEDLQRWRLPDRVLQPGEYLLVWASGKDRPRAAGELHTDFRLSRDGEPVLLVEPDGQTIADRIDPVALPRDVSYGRDSDNPARLCYFVRPTPGEPNTTDCADDMAVGPPELSLPGGFYDEPVEVAISVPSDETIIYTLDGSYPDLERNPDSTHRYDGPIRIEDRSAEPDVLSRVRTTILSGWRPPDEPVQKGTVVRARTVYSDEVAATYFVGSHLRRPDLPVVSIASDPDHLFDFVSGIMVPGEKYEQWRESDDYDPDYPSRWRPANYRGTGRGWERPAEDNLERSIIFTYCEPGTDACELTQNVGLRIHGGVTRTRAQKSLRLYARNDYGARTIDYPFFGSDVPASHRRLLLRNSGSDFGATMLMDGYAQSLVSHLYVDTQGYQPTAVFINGEYWGILNLRERHDRHYLAITHDVDPAEVVFLSQDGRSTWRHYDIREGVEGDEEPFLELIDHLARNDPADDATVDHVATRLDLDNFVDYLVLQTFFSNSDWPQNNVRIWRYRTDPIDDAELHPADGRWRYVVFDLDAVGGNRLDVDHNNLVRAVAVDEEEGLDADTGIPFLFSSLLENERFAARFINRFADHLNTTFDPRRTVARVDALEELLTDEMHHHAARWNHQQPVEDWHDHLDRLRDFMAARPDVQRQQLADFFSLEGTAELHVRHDDEVAGMVRVNTIELTADTPGISDPTDWRGRYFVGVPITLQATPADGWRFVRWDGLPGPVAADEQATLTVSGDLTVQPVFARE